MAVRTNIFSGSLEFTCQSFVKSVYNIHDLHFGKFEWCNSKCASMLSEHH